MSQVSNWLGAPTRNNMMQFTSFLGLTAPAALRPSRSGRVSPSTESEPACRKSRRVSPSQNRTDLLVSSRNIFAVPLYRCLPQSYTLTNYLFLSNRIRQPARWFKLPIYYVLKNLGAKPLHSCLSCSI